MSHPKMVHKSVPRQQSCLSVKPLYRCLMVRCESAEQIIAQTYCSDTVLQASWFDVRDQGSEQTATRLAVKAGTTIYLAASEFALWYYVVSWVKAAQRYVCSCRQAKQLGCCSHIEQVGRLGDTVV